MENQFHSKIEINNSREILSIQQEFSRVFPRLKIEFYEKGNGAKTMRIANRIKRAGTLAECREIDNSGFISIKSGMTVNQLKKEFNEGYGLKIDIFP